MRIGVDACSWSNARGYGRFTRELLRAMVAASPTDEFVCFLDRWTEKDFDLHGPNISTVCIEQTAAPTKAAAADGYRSPADMLRLTRATWREAVDVFFSPSVYTYFPLPPGLPAVVTIHDAIAERFPELTLPTRRARLFWKMKVRLAIWQARIILTVSEYAAREIASILNISPARIRVTGEAPASSYRPTRSSERIRKAAEHVGVARDAPWLVFVGGFNPHKNVEVVVRAHAAIALERKGPPLHLVLVGAPERDVFYGDLGKIRAAISKAGTEHLVKWAGFIPDEELRHLHSGAIALLLPSESEGFGLPAVEAAACGAPVIATTESPLPELLEGGGIFVPPGDEAAVTDAIRLLLDDEEKRKRIGNRARRQASKLSWPESANIALSALREAAS